MRQEKWMLGAIAFQVYEDEKKEKKYCDACDKRLRPGDRVFRCIECWNFDVCASCSHSQHPVVTDIVRDTYDPCATTTTKTLQNTFSIFEDYPCLGTRQPGPAAIYTWLTYADVLRRSRLISAWLASMFHLPTRDNPLRIVLCSENRVEWLLMYFAVVWRSATVVPLNKETDPSTLQFILRKVKPSLVVCSASVLSKFLACQHLLQHILVMPDQKTNLTSSTPPAAAASDSVASQVIVHDWEEAENHKLPIPPYTVEEPSQVALIRFTSGSTGQPKGAIVTYAAWNADLCSRARISNILITYAPLAHSAHSNVLHTLCGGGRTNLYAGDPALLYEEMRAVRPTQVSGPPRFWNVLYEQYKESLEQRLKAKPQVSYAMVEEEVLREYSTCLGDRLQHLSIGSAPASPAVLDWMRRCFKVTVTDGYGTVETGNITSNYSKTNDVEIKLVDWGEYKTTDKPFPRGEICVKSPSMASGYFEDEENTSEHFREGWFHTGDIGQLEGHRYRIIDRKKNIFKLAQGLYISPEKIEAVYVASKYVSQVFVHGDSLLPYPVAVVVPPVSFLVAWTKERGYSTWKEGLPKLESEIMQDFYSLAEAADLAPYERVRKILIKDEPWTVQNGLLTMTSKLCRPALTRHFAAELQQLCSEHEAAAAANPHELLRRLASEQLGRPLTKEDLSRLPSLGLDSLTAARLALIFNREANVTLTPTSLFSPNLSSVLDGQVVPPKFDFVSECALPSDLSISTTLDDISATPSHIFLTGCTGFFGLHLLASLFLRLSSHVSVLIRAASVDAAKEKLEKAAKTLSVWPLLETRLDRVTVYAGDLTLPRFGLSQVEYDTLCSSVVAVVHNAAYVNHVLPYENLKAANVTATLDIIRFCCQKRLKRLHFISTISVGEADEKLLESPSDISMRDVPEGGYSRSKWVAEQLVTAAMKKGLPSAVYRIGMLTWHHVTGACNPEAYIHRLMIGLVQLSAFPDSSVYFNMVPVDFAADAVVAFIESAVDGKAINIVHPIKSIPLHELTSAIRSFGYFLSELPWRDFRLLIERSSSCSLFPLLSNFHHGLPGSHSRPSTTVAKLVESGKVTCPIVSAGVVHALLRYAIANNLIAPPTTSPPAAAAAATNVDETSKSGEMTQALDIFAALGVAPTAGRARLRRSDDSALSRISLTTQMKKRDGLKREEF